MGILDSNWMVIMSTLIGVYNQSEYPYVRRVQRLENFPEGVLPDDFAPGELEQVHAAHFDLLSRRRCTGERPFRHPEVATRPVCVVSVMHVGNPLEPFCEPGAHRVFSFVRVSPWPSASRHVKHAVVGKEAHDRIQIMAVERVEELLQKLDRYGL